MSRAKRALVVAVLGALGFPSQGVAQVPSGAIVVMPFENAREEVRLVWLREGSAMLLTDLLAARGRMVIDRDERVRAFERLQLPPAASLSRASSIKVGHVVGATSVAIGAFEVAADQLTARARLMHLDTGRLLPEVVARGPIAELLSVFGSLAQQLDGTEPTAGNLAGFMPPSPRVFELFVKGLTADTPAGQQAFLGQALAAGPQYDRARAALWRVHTDAGDHQRALDTISNVGPGSRLAREARFFRALSLLNLKQFDEAFRAFHAEYEAGQSAAVANAMGVIELRRPATPQPGRATYYFSQATEADPADGDLFFNLGYAYWGERDAAAAIYWLREAVRRDPGDGEAHFILGAALQQTGAAAEAAREGELASRLSSRFAAWSARAASGGDPVPRGLERLHTRLTRPTGGVDTLISLSGQRDQAALAQFHLDAGRRAYARSADREAVDELRRALYLSPYLAEAHLLIGRLYLRDGRATDAIAALKIALWSEETAEGHLALAEAYLHEQDTAAARAEVDRALALEPRSAEAERLKAKIGGAP